MAVDRSVGGPVDVTLWWADLTMADAALEASLPEPERARLDEVAAGADRARRMVGAALLQHAVREHRRESTGASGAGAGAADEAGAGAGAAAGAAAGAGAGAETGAVGAADSTPVQEPCDTSVGGQTDVSHRSRTGMPAPTGEVLHDEVVVDRTCEECGAQHGRPVVAGGPHVSVAHAGVLVVVATCAHAPVGVDVERVARFDGSTGRAREWVVHEARVKAGLVDATEPAGGTGDSGSVMVVEAPMDGYMAALAATGRPAVASRRFQA